MPSAATNLRPAPPENVSAPAPVASVQASAPFPESAPARPRHSTLGTGVRSFLDSRPRLAAHLALLRTTCRELFRPTPEGRAQAAYFRRHFAREHLGPVARWRRLADYHRCHAQFGADAFDYVLFRFAHRSDAEKAGYVTDHVRHDYYRRLNRLENKSIFKNKDETYQRFGPYFRRDFLFVRDASAWPRFRAFCDRHARFICKPRDAACGQHVRLGLAAELGREDAFRAFLARYDGGLVVEELIRQAPATAAFHPSSVNTIRVVTVNLGAHPLIYHPMLRTGTGGAIVDNGGAGGILAAIDPATGEIETDGQNREGAVFARHPETGTVYRGTRIPRWDELLALAGELTQIIPTNRYTGWDFALGEQGWVLVEANDRAQFLGHQMVTGNGCRHEFEAILAAHGL